MQPYEELYVSYRPEDTAEIVAHIREVIEARSGDSIPPGQDFRQAIQAPVRQSSALLAVIGERWLTLTHATGQRCLDDPDDTVRMELEAAFAHGVPVFAVLVGGATLPEPEELPRTLAALSTCQVVSIQKETLYLLTSMFRGGLGKVLRRRDLNALLPREKYFCYASRPRLEQLRALPEIDGARASDGSTSALMNYGFRVLAPGELFDSRAIAEQLSTTLEVIGERKKVVELEKLCQEQRGLRLDAFCYTYRGRFRCLGILDRDARSALGSMLGGEEVFLSEEFLRAPAREENAYHEVTSDQVAAVSDIAVLSAELPPYTLRLACPLKFFSDMGGTLHQDNGEWEIRPHSGNRHFFWGHVSVWLDSVLFIHGMTEHTLWGSPLCLTHQPDPALYL